MGATNGRVMAVENALRPLSEKPGRHAISGRGEPRLLRIPEDQRLVRDRMTPAIRSRGATE